MEKKNNLLLIVSDFWRVEAPFLIPELEKVATKFHKITIINTSENNQTKNNLKNLSFETDHFQLLKNINFITIIKKEKNNFLPKLFKLWNISLIKELIYCVCFIKKIRYAALKDIISYHWKAQSFFTELTQQIKLGDYDILYTYWLDFHTLALIQNKTRLKSKIISRAHNWDVYFERTKSGYLPFRKVLLRNLDLFCPISEHSKKYLCATLKENFQNIQVSKLGIHAISEDKSIKFNTNKVRILSISYISPVKRVALLLEAMTCIPSSINIEWIHIGPGKDLMHLQEKSHALTKLKPNIAIEFKGFMDIKEVQVFLKNEVIDLHINVSAFEGIPVSIMEAISCGIPCIATNVGGNAEIVNAKNGTLISKNPTKEEIADAITAFYNLSQEERIDKSKQAKQTWELEYNAAINFEKFSKLLMEL